MSPVYAGCAQLASPQTDDLLLDRFLGMMVLARSCSDLSSWPMIVQPWVHRVIAFSALPIRACSSSLLLTQHLSRKLLYQWLKSWIMC